MMILGRNPLVWIFLGLWLLAAAGCCTAEANLVVDQADWYLTLEDGGSGVMFGSVYLHLRGSTSADRVTVRTFGDGLMADVELPLDGSGNFDLHVLIAFTHAPDATIRTYSTVVTAYLNSDSTSQPLTSPPLSFY